MGYTHYWKSKGIPMESWNAIIADAQKLIDASPVKLAHEEGEQEPPTVNDVQIFFNAFDEDEAHETFVLTRNAQEFEFCKTAYKRYDFVVCGILSVAAEKAPDYIEVTSDGDESDWRAPLAWASGILGRELKFPVKKERERDPM